MPFQTKDGRIAYVATGPAGGFTFYLREQKPRVKGKRVRGRGKSLWFQTKEAAEAALPEYAKSRGWKEAK